MGPKKDAAGKGAKAKAARAEAALVGPTPVEDPLESALPSASEIEQEPCLRNWKRWGSLKNKLKLQNMKTGSVPNLLPQKIEAFLSDDVQSRRQFEVQSLEFVKNSDLPTNKNLFPDRSNIHSDFWKIVVRNEAVKTQVDPARRTAWLPSDLMLGRGEQHASKVADILCDLLNKSPAADISLRPTDGLAQMLYFVAARKADDNRNDLAAYIARDLTFTKSFIAFNLAYDGAGGRDRYIGRLSIFDSKLQPHSGASKFSINVKDVSLKRPMPTIPDFLQNMLPETSTTGLDFDALSEEKKEQHRRARQLARYVQFIMFGACGDKAEIVQQAGVLASLYKVATITSQSPLKNLSGIYGGGKLWALHKRNHLGLIAIAASQHTLGDVLLTGDDEQKTIKTNRVQWLPEIYVLGYSKARVSAVLEIMLQAWIGGDNLVETWDHGVKKADQVNMTAPGHNFVHRCDHTETERKSKVHVCQNCMGVTFCSDMYFAPGGALRVCAECIQEILSGTLHVDKVSGFLPDPKSDDPQKAAGGEGFRSRLLLDFRSEVPSLSKRRAIAEEFHREHFRAEDGTWDDHMFAAQRSDYSGRADTSPSPWLASPDAGFPFFVTKDDETVYHHSSNVVPTATYVNQGTNTFLKANIKTASEAQKLRNEPYSAYDQINNRFDHHMAVRTKYPHKRKLRLDLQMSKQQYESARNEMHTGILVNTSETVPALIRRKPLKKYSWTVKTHRRIDSLIEQMLARKSGLKDSVETVVLPRSPRDGAPFPWRSEHMPDDWNWNMLEEHLAYHYDLMWLWCDWDFDTDEDPETLLLALIWQWIENGGRDPWLRLPMTLYAFHAAEYAIGHIRHGQAMRTGFPVGIVITDIAQRVGRLCNTVFEPRIANYMKMNYAASEYADIQDDLASKCKDECDVFAQLKAAVPPVKFQVSTASKVRERSYRLLAKTAQATADDDIDDVVDEEELVTGIADDFEKVSS